MAERQVTRKRSSTADLRAECEALDATLARHHRIILNKDNDIEAIRMNNDINLRRMEDVRGVMVSQLN